MRRLLVTVGASVVLHLGLFQVSFSGNPDTPEVAVDRGKTSIAMQLQRPSPPEPTETEETTEEPEPEKPKPEEPEPTKKKDPPEEKKPEKETRETREEKKKTEEQEEPEQKKKQAPSRKQTGARMVKKADYLRNPSPEYPSVSRERGEEGTVLLRVRIDREGEPLEVNVRESSGYKRLDRAAVETVSDWSFSPAEEDGSAVRSNVLVPVKFNID